MHGIIPRTMNALVYHGANDLRIETLPVPSLKADELLVKVEACGVCPTDIKKIQYGLVKPPRVFGHEIAGTIVKTGAGVRGFRVGERVALHHHVPCLKCHACLHEAFAQCKRYKQTGTTAGFEPAGGGFAEYVKVLPFVMPGIVRIPRKNTFVEGAMLEPVNTVLKAIHRLRLRRGDWVAVIGQGPIGLMFTGLLTARGARVVANDLIPERLRLAGSFGASLLLSQRLGEAEDLIAKATRGAGLDAVVVAVPSDQAVLDAMRLVRGGGQVILFAHTKRGENSTLDYASVCVDEKDLIGSYSADYSLQKEVARLVFSRTLDVRPLVSHWFPMGQAVDAIHLCSQAKPGALKIVVGTSEAATGMETRLVEDAKNGRKSGR